ncbi:2-oxoglutarate dehydrogenase E2 component [Paenibacillus sp. UNCCL117]|uniref:2-oxoglutarate dehydrogenase complex dihydrolipoyllysine-residue succinyltransferase n=1 Tax=unclassified Paenibacillus TaxID=185978 RepID=UPI000882B0B8|nr:MULTISPECIES: 2-oxoglutarate dehydrogenase complex dihydrolipoyllysine-residue succinyltransferase [unclassified Paenibacillus]SDD70743.1 2-oxoglutarate dehydrogenase E2 component [Paenibacillus sp. cl123]SFW45403.1 2-oxoglutarate dehydrogenase E2 component [Paenibacillus sp. UNCCL117]
MSEIKVPEMGESITEGTISRWIVQEGQNVRQGDLLLELETDKVNMEISAEQDGVIDKILKQEGENVQIGEVIGMISVGAASSPSGTANVDTSAGVTSAAPQPEASAVPGAATAPPGSPVVEAGGDAGEGGPLSASPAARRLAREKGVDVRQVTGQDPIGRVYEPDVRNAAAGGSLAAATGGIARSAAAQPGAPAATPSGAQPPVRPAAPAAAGQAGKPSERKRMSRRRATIAKRLVEAQRTAAMLTTFNEVDMTAILDIRKRRKQSFQEKHDVGLGFMSFFTKAVVGALKKFPLLNAEIDGEDIIVKQYYDIGIAVSAKEGLVVPVVRDANQLGFAEIEKKIAELAGKARSNSLEIADLQGGTFTITNGGVFGSLLSTPILNAPQVGILGMHKIQLRPVAIDADRMENRPMMYIALSYDHRIVDGSEAVSFLVKVKELLEDPETLLLEG